MKRSGFLMTLMAPLVAPLLIKKEETLPIAESGQVLMIKSGVPTWVRAGDVFYYGGDNRFCLINSACPES